MLDDQVCRRVERFVFEEARLLDAGQFEAWLNLYEPQGIYWMPSQPDQTDPLNVASIIYEDYEILSIRVQRLLEARALVLTPMPRTTHLVGNVEVRDQTADALIVDAAFVCVEYQADQQRMYSGRHTHHLLPADDTLPHRHEACRAGEL